MALPGNQDMSLSFHSNWSGTSLNLIQHRQQEHCAAVIIIILPLWKKSVIQE